MRRRHSRPPIHRCTPLQDNEARRRADMRRARVATLEALTRPPVAAIGGPGETTSRPAGGGPVADGGPVVQEVDVDGQPQEELCPCPTPPAPGQPDLPCGSCRVSDPVAELSVSKVKCHICKAWSREVHHFYDQLCLPCGDLNFAKVCRPCFALCLHPHGILPGSGMAGLALSWPWTLRGARLLTCLANA